MEDEPEGEREAELDEKVEQAGERPTLCPAAGEACSQEEELVEGKPIGQYSDEQNIGLYRGGCVADYVQLILTPQLSLSLFFHPTTVANTNQTSRPDAQCEKLLWNTKRQVRPL